MQIYVLIFKFQLSLQIFFVLPHRFFNFFLEFLGVFLLEGGVGYPFKGVESHISAGTVDYTGGEGVRTNLLKGRSSAKPEAYESLARG